MHAAVRPLPAAVLPFASPFLIPTSRARRAPHAAGGSILHAGAVPAPRDLPPHARRPHSVMAGVLDYDQPPPVKP
ncbi:hypothetical protein DM47_2555 [Burkholderia mallei]|nr:hypothetical protein X948_5587 [Burkholderia pseudomallei MSHR5608]KOT19305.1 hypothetical protein DM47_2555 [Burkholderia mallei]